MVLMIVVMAVGLWGGEGERKGVLDIKIFKHFLIRPFLVSIHPCIHLSLHENHPKRLHQTYLYV